MYNRPNTSIIFSRRQPENLNKFKTDSSALNLNTSVNTVNKQMNVSKVMPIL